MNKKLFWLGSLAVGAAFTLNSCGEDYLQTYPESEMSSELAKTKIEYCNNLVNGVLKTMSTQMFSRQGENGEGTTKTWHNNYCSGFIQRCNLTGWSGTIAGKGHVQTNNAYGTARWTYYYKMIINANNAIAAIEEFDSTNKEHLKQKEYYLAQCYTLRAYAYMQLTQLFCKRWPDSRNGESRGLILRLKTTTEELPCSSLRETFDQIYADLDLALEKFKDSGCDRTKVWQVNADVAHAIYSRAAIYREDWQTSADHAKLARKDYPLMGADNYFKGFCEENEEWIWSLYSAPDETLYYYGYFAYEAANGSPGTCRNNPSAIDKIFYNKIPDTDVRKKLYAAPTDEEFNETDKNGDYYISRTNGLATSGSFYKRVWDEYGEKLYNDGTSISRIFMYMQFKVLCQSNPGIGQLNLARAAEMYYNEAESLCKLGRDAEARELLIEAVKPYDANYTCDLSGNELYEEIKKYRIFDLLLEGYTYFDERRWNQDRVRISIADNGSWHKTFSGVDGPETYNGWTWCIPQQETDYNQFIDKNIEPDNWSKDDKTTW